MDQENEQVVGSNKPPGDKFRQQKLTAWQPIMTPLRVIIVFILIGIIFIPTGTSLIDSSNEVYEKRIMYDGDDRAVDCQISTENEGKICTLTFNIDEDVDGPLHVYYEIENMYQNHRKYVSSKDTFQLQGENRGKSDLETSCVSDYENGSLVLNPCGLIANSLFTDVFTLNSNNYTLDESDIAWPSDDDKFIQPNGFKSSVVTSTDTTCADVNLPDDCQAYTDPATGTMYLFHYPSDDSTQYLYETYPNIISPIDGVTDQHFKVWMRPAALPKFRKLYGKISGDFKNGDILTFTVEANYQVDDFDGSKSLVISNLGEFGGRNPFLGVAFVVVGCISLLFALLFVVKQAVAPRAIADPSLLSWT